MRTISTGLATYLATAVNFRLANLVTVTLSSGVVCRWTTYDADITYGGHTFLSHDALIERGATRVQDGLSVDALQMTLGTGGANVTLGGIPLAAAVEQGVLDNAAVTVERLCMPGPGDVSLGTVLMFSGHVAGTEPAPMAVKLTIKSGLEKLNSQIPYTIQPGCPYQVYSAACGLSRAAYTTALTTVAGTNQTELWVGSDLSTVGVPSSVKMTSGANAGVRRMVRFISGYHVSLRIGLPYAVAIGDTFEITKACPKTRMACLTTFNNLVHFRGFADVPRPETI